ncbi:MAG: hypothetical protein J5I52_05530 [Saprospiraceae bacterium]|nr:MAG: MORN repeat-containing protein [Bacteroidetes bacterium OLB9]MCO6463591.1 hypothetical protein [Saprospiraceae bacterium]
MSLLNSLKLLAGIVLVTVAFSSCKSEQSEKPAAQEEIVETYGSGEVSRKYNRINGKIEGTMTDYFPSGKIKGEKNFVNGKQEGKTTIYYESGNLKEVQYYISGKKTGGDTLYHDNGTMMFICQYKDGIEDGIMKKWDEEGNKLFDGKFDMGKLIEVDGQPVKQEPKYENYN